MVSVKTPQFETSMLFKSIYLSQLSQILPENLQSFDPSELLYNWLHLELGVHYRGKNKRLTLD